jgi:YD repeat-containing protein
MDSPTYDGTIRHAGQRRRSFQPQVLDRNKTLTVANSLYYDAASRTITDTTPGGRKLIVSYDHLMRPVREEIVGLQPSFYTYDNRGRLQHRPGRRRKHARTFLLTTPMVI